MKSQTHRLSAAALPCGRDWHRVLTALLLTVMLSTNPQAGQISIHAPLRAPYGAWEEDHYSLAY
ncbi:hypothetical protein NQZ68_036155 [Dissostichus eleginoides]|nr:hypothetical protein NQZ68_036155 [Dissostichus eleginoides]